MLNLKLEKVWAVYGNREGYIQPNGEPAVATDPATLVDCATAQKHFARLADGRWPVAHTLALSLDASRCIAIDLLNAWDEPRSQPVSGAWLWLQSCMSYAELCWPNAGERAVRIIARGRVPSGAVVPPRVKITTAGFVTLTTQRIPSRPAWQGADNGGLISDVTQALEHLLVARTPQYISM